MYFSTALQHENGRTAAELAKAVLLAGAALLASVLRDASLTFEIYSQRRDASNVRVEGRASVLLRGIARENSKNHGGFRDPALRRRRGGRGLHQVENGESWGGAVINIYLPRLRRRLRLFTSRAPARAFLVSYR